MTASFSVLLKVKVGNFMAEISMFEVAHENTNECAEQLIIQKKQMSDQLGFTARQVIKNAKMEIAFAKIEGISEDRLSPIAQRLLLEPELSPDDVVINIRLAYSLPQKIDVKDDEYTDELFGATMEGYQEKDGIFFKVVKEDSKEKTFMQVDRDKRTQEQNITPEQKVEQEQEIEPTPEVQKKKHSNKRREPFLKQEIVIPDACTVVEYFLRPTENEQKAYDKARKARAEGEQKIKVLQKTISKDDELTR